MLDPYYSYNSFTEFYVKLLYYWEGFKGIIFFVMPLKMGYVLTTVTL